MRVLIVSAAFGLLLLQGCITPQKARKMESDNETLRLQVDSLRTEMSRLHSGLGKAESPALQARESALRTAADTELRLNEFSEQLRVLNDRVDDLDNRVTNLPNKMRVAAEKLAAATPPAPAANDSVAKDQMTRPPAANAAEKSATVEISKLYDTAYQDLVRGQFDLARQGFLEFLRRFPESTLTDNAQYWIGESYYSQQQYQRAAAEFAKVMEDYPSGDKVPAAMLKRGFALISMGKRSEAKVLLEQLIKKYPKSQEAELARARIKDL